MTQAEYARRWGVSNPTVVGWIRKGWVVPTVVQGRRLIDPTKNDERVAAARKGAQPSTEMTHAASAPRPRGRPPRVVELDGAEGGEQATYWEVKTRHEKAKAEAAELKLDELRGRLIDRRATTRAVYELARSEREAWLNWPAKYAPRLAARLGVDRDEVRRLLDSGVREHLAKLAAPKLKLPKQAQGEESDHDIEEHDEELDEGT